jgi:hypothetical protein
MRKAESLRLKAQGPELNGKQTNNCNFYFSFLKDERCKQLITDN